MRETFRLNLNVKKAQGLQNIPGDDLPPESMDMKTIGQSKLRRACIYVETTYI